ncbi:hypothetical protein CHU98_g12160 [Xylaria longipes]|nr:hypothetical protein CHU98_g12160 [Xylaria longipes]
MDPQQRQILEVAYECMDVILNSAALDRQSRYRLRGLCGSSAICLAISPSRRVGLKLDSFTSLSSLSGIYEHIGQANYVAGNVFLDLFAAYHRSCGQPAYSIHLGISGDAGVIAERAKLKESVDSPMYRGLNEGQLRKILYFALLQQQKKHLAGTHDLEHSPMIIGFVAMQLDDSILKMDARFSPLFNGRDGSGEQVASSGNGGNTNTDVQALPLLLRTQFAERAAKLQAMVDVVNGFFMRVLRLSERIMDAGRPITVYGTDSLPLSRWEDCDHFVGHSSKMAVTLGESTGWWNSVRPQQWNEWLFEAVPAYRAEVDGADVMPSSARSPDRPYEYWVVEAFVRMNCPWYAGTTEKMVFIHPTSKLPDSLRLKGALWETWMLMAQVKTGHWWFGTDRVTWQL